MVYVVFVVPEVVLKGVIYIVFVRPEVAVKCDILFCV